jgi:uncharacterized protein YutE (UPF0331/DUF86 family)
VKPDAVVNRRLKDLLEKVRYLRSQQAVELRRLREDLGIRLAVERAFQLAIQSVLDIAAHVLAAEGWNDWDEYRELGPKLAEHGVLANDLGEAISRMAGFRNLLVHEYAVIKPHRMRDYLRRHLDDFDEFAKAIRAHLRRGARLKSIDRTRRSK